MIVDVEEIGFKFCICAAYRRNFVLFNIINEETLLFVLGAIVVLLSRGALAKNSENRLIETNLI